MKDIINKIRLHITKQRKYASHFDWFNREKGIKEKGIVQTLLEHLPESEGCLYYNLRISKEDPPDCEADSSSNGLIGFEVTELVDQEAVEINQKAKKKEDEVLREWNTEDVEKKIQEIIHEKDRKKYKISPYEKIILVIHTDEPLLTYNDFAPNLKKHHFEKTRQISKAFLLFSYDAEKQNYPYLELNIGL